jgi:protein TonB
LGDASNTNPKVDTTKPTPVVYPENAQRAGEEGTVVVGVYVTESGRVTRANVAKSSGYTDLDNAAIETAMRWHFVPAIHSGKVAADWASVQVVYKLPQNAAR